MPLISNDNQIASGHNQAGALQRFEDIADANGVYFVMPRAIDYVRGARRFRTDGTSARVGYDSIRWRWSVMTKAQYNTMVTTYEGLVTVRLALTTTTYANYNASLWMIDPAEFEYIPQLPRIGLQHTNIGPGYRDVIANLVKLEAL